MINKLFTHNFSSSASGLVSYSSYELEKKKFQIPEKNELIAFHIIPKNPGSSSIFKSSFGDIIS